MALRKDIWRSGIACDPRSRMVESGIACDPLSTILERGSLAGSRIVWLPEESAFRFLADPFGLWRDGHLHVFVEAYDYRVRVGSIEVLTFAPDLKLVGRSPALSEPWHLSYPHVFEADGECWMLPEAHRGGGLTLYHCARFPNRWTRAVRIDLPDVAIDASPVYHQDRWWLFYSPGTSEFSKQGMLHAAFAERLEGPWTAHSANPLRIGKDGSRPAGRAVSHGAHILLPVQDCRRTYGAAARPLRIEITPTDAALNLGDAVGPPADTLGHDAGLHTLSEAGPVTLFDVKRIDLSARGIAMEGAREWRKLRARLRP